MKAFFKVLNIEFKMLRKMEHFICMLLVAFISFIFLKIGIDSYRGVLDEEASFKKFEKVMIERIPNYKLYAVTGHRLFFVHAPTSVFFSSSIDSSSLNAEVDNADVLEIYRQARGKKMFSEKPGWASGFSGMLLIFGGALCIYYGFSAFRDKDYLTMLSSIGGRVRVFLYIFLARLFIIALYFAVLFAAAVFYIIIKGVVVAGSFFLYTAVLYLGLMLTMMKLFAAGVCVSMLKPGRLVTIMLFLTWLSISLGIPRLVEIFYKNNFDQIESVHEINYKALTNLIKFQERADKAAGKYDDSQRLTKKRIDLAESYWKTEFKRILELDRQLREKCIDHLWSYRKLSAFLPGAFYVSIAESVSGCGYENELEFSDFVYAFKSGFCRHFIDETFSSKNPKIRNFVKNGENVFRSTPGLPQFFYLGITVSLAYFLLFSAAGCFFFVRRQKILPAKRVKSLNTTSTIELENGIIEVWITKGPDLSVLMQGLLSGSYKYYRAKGYEKDVIVDGENIAASRFNGTYFSICSLAQIPGEITVGDIAVLAGKLEGLKTNEIKRVIHELGMTGAFHSKIAGLGAEMKANIVHLLLQLIPRDVCLIGDVVLELEEKETYRFMNQLQSAVIHDGPAVFFLVTEVIYGKVTKYSFKEEAVLEGVWRNRSRSVKAELEGCS